MEKNLFNLLNHELRVKPENIFFPNPKDIDRVSDLIDDIGGADICFGGIGINGHIAFNEPISPYKKTSDEFMRSKTRILDLAYETIIMTSLKCNGNMDMIPKRCITLGMSDIFKSKELRFYLEHDYQNAALIKSIFEEPNPYFPASYIKLHRNSTITISKNVMISKKGENECP